MYGVLRIRSSQSQSLNFEMRRGSGEGQVAASLPYSHCSQAVLQVCLDFGESSNIPSFFGVSRNRRHVEVMGRSNEKPNVRVASACSSTFSRRRCLQFYRFKNQRQLVNRYKPVPRNRLLLYLQEHNISANN